MTTLLILLSVIPLVCFIISIRKAGSNKLLFNLTGYLHDPCNNKNSDFPNKIILFASKNENTYVPALRGNYTAAIEKISSKGVLKLELYDRYSINTIYLENQEMSKDIHKITKDNPFIDLEVHIR